MSEKHITKNSSPEKRIEHEQLEKIADRQTERARELLERAERDHAERPTEAEALHEARKLASEESKPAEHLSPIPAERRRGPLSKKQLDNSFSSQMTHAREHMSPASRAFSSFIHSKPVETASDIVSSTLARPNAMLSGSVVAFIAITVLYFTAKYFGFPLSGFETIAAFIAGWVLGVLYDYVTVALRGRQ